ncbi:MAG: glycosyltransferase family 39 protein [Chloroflexota bacterium]
MMKIKLQTRKGWRWIWLWCFIGLCVNLVTPLSMQGQTNFVMLEIHYHLAEESEVLLAWGIDGWQHLDQDHWTSGTFLRDQIMHTPMQRENNMHIAQIHVPLEAQFDYGFLVTKQQGDPEAPPIWDGDYQTIAQLETLIEIESTLNAPNKPADAESPAVTYITQEIRYHTQDADKVLFVWGIDGWNLVPEVVQPTDTVISDGLMNTHMMAKDDVFVTKIQVPEGAKIDFGFQVTKKNDPGALQVWDGVYEQQPIIATPNGVANIDVTRPLAYSPLSAFRFDLQRRGTALLLLAIGFAAVLGGRFAAHKYGEQSYWYLTYFRNNTIVKLVLFALAIRFVVFFVGYLSIVAYANPDNHYVDFETTYVEQLLVPFGHGDPVWYRDIALNGYEQRPFSLERKANWPFYPLWPFVWRMASLFITNMNLAGIAASTLFFILNVIFLYKLLRLDFDQSIAELAAILLIIFPASYLLSRPVPESLFLFLTITSIYGARKNRWVLAGILAGLATFTRLPGILLAFPLLFLYYRYYQETKQLDKRILSLLFIPLSLFLFMFHLYWVTGEFFANFKMHAMWDQRLSYPAAALVEFLSEPRLIDYYGWSLTPINFVFTFLAIALTLVMVMDSRVPREYVIYTILNMGIIISRDTLEAGLRFLIPIFPLFLILSLLIYKRQYLYQLIFFSFTALQIFYFISFLQKLGWAAN